MNTDNKQSSLPASIVATSSRRLFLKGLGAATVAATAPVLLARPAMSSTVFGTPWGRPLVDRWRDDCGLIHNGINRWWADQCELLPCFHGVAFSGYAEKIETYMFGDMPVIIHLWKGHCPQNPTALPGDRTQYPGGKGAEVGIYRVRGGSWIQKNTEKKKQQKDSIWNGHLFLNNANSVLSGFWFDKWYPAPELKPHIEFTMHDYKNNVMINTQSRYDYIKLADKDKPEDFYWCTEWLEDSSYEKWAKTMETWKPGNALADSLSLGLDWAVTINGIKVKGKWYGEAGTTPCNPYPLGGCPNLNRQQPDYRLLVRDPGLSQAERIEMAAAKHVPLSNAVR